jgi:hypothetical protein
MFTGCVANGDAVSTSVDFLVTFRKKVKKSDFDLAESGVLVNDFIVGREHVRDETLQAVM